MPQKSVKHCLFGGMQAGRAEDVAVTFERFAKAAKLTRHSQAEAN